MKVTILGCGGSSGTPALDWGWGLCDPSNPRNRRLRASILVQDGPTNLLVDTSPDLREQILGVNIDHLDAVLYTHFHADHLHGIDDLRPFNRSMDRELDIYADTETLKVIRERFGYVLEPLTDGATIYYKPTLHPHEIHDGETLNFGSINVSCFQQDHGFCSSMGFRFGPIGYSTDVVDLPESAFDALKGVEVWIIGTLMDHPHPTHAHVDKALEWIERIKPRRAVLTHMTGRLDYATLCESLPRGVEPAYDGLVIEA